MNDIKSASEFTKYQNLESLAKVQDIFREPEVVCTEKIHGTNARLGLIDGKLRIGGRNQDHTNDLQGDSVMGFVKWVCESGLEEQLKIAFGQQNIIFFGEWFGQGIQKGITYCSEKQFRVFDIRLDGHYLDWDLVVQFSKFIGLKTVPVLYRGFPKLDVFDKLLDIVSEVGKENGIINEQNLHEGIVIKPAKMKISSMTGEWLIAKYKPARWSERKSEKVKKDFKQIPGDVYTFVDEFVTETRLDHVIDHLRDQEIEVVDMTATPYVLKEMNLDILREAKDEIEKLTANDTVEWKSVSKLISNKTMVFLRQYLHKRLEQSIQNQQKI